MKSMRLILESLIVILALSLAVSSPGMAGDDNGDGGDYWDAFRQCNSDILIISDSNPRAFFGFYRTSQMTEPGWTLARRCIDWADGMLGPAEWDVSFVWFWTLTRDRDAMRRFLTARFGENGLPDGLARRCLGAILLTYESSGLWEEFVQRYKGLQSDPVWEMTTMLFPTDVFA